MHVDGLFRLTRQRVVARRARGAAGAAAIASSSVFILACPAPSSSDPAMPNSTSPARASGSRCSSRPACACGFAVDLHDVGGEVERALGTPRRPRHTRRPERPRPRTPGSARRRTRPTTTIFTSPKPFGVQRVPHVPDELRIHAGRAETCPSAGCTDLSTMCSDVSSRTPQSRSSSARATSSARLHRVVVVVHERDQRHVLGQLFRRRRLRRRDGVAAERGDERVRNGAAPPLPRTATPAPRVETSFAPADHAPRSRRPAA